jgi:hypothetical protein
MQDKIMMMHAYGCMANETRSRRCLLQLHLRPLRCVLLARLETALKKRQGEGGVLGRVLPAPEVTDVTAGCDTASSKRGEATQ